MRGPGLRTQIDIRRTWRCSLCQRVRRVAATEVTVRCGCHPSRPLMQLVEGKRPVRVQHPPLPQYFELEEELEDLQSVEATLVEEQPAQSTSSPAPLTPPVSVVTTLHITTSSEEEVPTGTEKFDPTAETQVMKPIQPEDPDRPGDPHAGF